MSLRRLLISGHSISSGAGEFGLLALRLFAGLTLALTHGIHKVPPSAGFVEGVAGLGFPLPPVFAWAAALSEFLGGLFLALGLLTRPSALMIAMTMSVAAFLQHSADPFARKEMALLYLFIAILYLLMGAGRWSLDALLRR